MADNKDFDYGICKIPRVDKNGNDITNDRIGKGGRHRDDGTYSGPVYDVEMVKHDPSQPQIQLAEKFSQSSVAVLLNETTFDIDIRVGKVYTTDLVAVIIKSGLVDRNLGGTAVTITFLPFQVGLIEPAEVLTELGSGQTNCVPGFFVIEPTLLVRTVGQVVGCSKTLATRAGNMVAVTIHHIITVKMKGLIIFHLSYLLGFSQVVDVL